MSSMKDEGNNNNNSEPGVAKQALAQKRNVRDLNTRLEMYVRAQAEKTRTVNQLKQALARNEMEYNQKLKHQKMQFQDRLEKCTKQIENLAYDNKCTHQELDQANLAKKEFEDRLISSEARNAALSSQCENLSVDKERCQTELDSLRKEYAKLKYNENQYKSEKNSFDEKISKFKHKNEQLLRDLTQKETYLKSEKEAFERVLIEKNDEIDNLRKKINELEITNNTTQTRLRKEFDNKLAEFVQKREEQYKQEKDEWMRIFKEEFNRKLRSFKEANQELSHVNIKQSEENTELRTRISKLKQQKTELEVTNRNLEEEGEKLRTDLDDVRRQKDQEIKQKNQIIMQQRDEYKAKELQFDELAGIKLQLDSEIELYRNILNEAEQASGYVSPLTTNNSNTGTRQSRKRKRVHMMTPMGNTPNGNFSFIKNNNNNDNSNNKENSNNGNVETPGIARAGKNAQNDLKHALQSDGSMVEDEEMKDHEEDSLMQSSYETPGNLEGARLQFSGLDLMKGMIELQNMSESPLSLNGYQLSNSCGYQLLDLPKDIILARGEKLRVYCGAEVSQRMNNEDLNKGYQGNYMFWNADVWTGKEKDCAKLQNPSGQVIAQIEISPDMVDMKLTNSKQGCLIM